MHGTVASSAPVQAIGALVGTFGGVWTVANISFGVTDCVGSFSLGRMGTVGNFGEVRAVGNLSFEDY